MAAQPQPLKKPAKRAPPIQEIPEGELPADGDEVIAWIEENCRIPAGKYVGANVVLRPWQREVIHGIYDTPTRLGIISFGRKNGKTSLAAFLLLVHLAGPRAEQNSELFSTAQSREQAAIIFALAAKIIRLSPKLQPHITIRDTIKELHCRELGTLYKALSAEASTSFGISTAFVVHDELAQVKGPKSELFDAVETSAGAHDNPLTVIISTQAPTDGDLLSILIDDAKKGADPETKLFMFSAPMDADPWAEETWKLANPAYGDFLNAKEVRKQANNAQRMPSREASFRNLILNQRVEATNPFVSLNVWEENGAKPAPLTKKTNVYAGLDLSSVADLCALEMVSEEGDVYSNFWLPKEGLVEKAHQDRVPYDVWEKQGILMTTPGRSIEYEHVAQYLREVFDSCNVVALGFDRYNMKFLMPWLKKAGFTDKELERFVEFGQGFASMSPALRDLESGLLAKKYKHGNNPILKMCAANAVVMKDPAGNRKFTKAKTTGRIDGMVALAMAVGVMPNQGPLPKKNQLFFV